MLQALKSVPQKERHSRSFGQRATGLVDWPHPMAALKSSPPFGKQQPWLWSVLALALKPSSTPHCLQDGGCPSQPRPRYTVAGSLRKAVLRDVRARGDPKSVQPSVARVPQAQSSGMLCHC